ncbi:hypothetical protein ACOJVU_02770 [Mycobacterium sp. THU-M104]|uniref:hypothetical protein n=1 Tax=Mycobacterium sp. THU-M104 TaxID=3410515 RepID=UPI003B9C7285
MRISPVAAASVAVAAVLVVATSGCGTHSTTSTPKSGSATSARSSRGPEPTSATPVGPGEYAGLLIKATDIHAPVTFTGSPPTENPNGQPGVATTFRDEDGSHLIKDTIRVFDDPAAATNALNAAKSAQGDIVKKPTSRPANIGTGGTTLSGDSPDGLKGVTVLLFTAGKALVTLQFDGPPGSLVPQEFMTDVGQKQDAAVKKGLGG